MVQKPLTLTLKYIALWSAAKFGCVWGFVVHGFLLGILLFPFLPLTALVPRSMGGMQQGFGGIALLVFVYAVISSIATCIGFTLFAIAFNVIAMLTGGLVFGMERTVKDKTPQPEPTASQRPYSYTNER